MALTCEQLTDEVKALVGRINDSTLITDARVARWLNEAQTEIVRRCPGLMDLEFKNITSLTTVASQIAYNLDDVTNSLADNTSVTCHLHSVYYLDGDESKLLDFKPPDEFDAKWPDPTHTDIDTGEPHSWTRRGNKIELFPLPSASYAGKALRIDGTRYPYEFTTNDSVVAQITDADDGLIAYAVSKAWGAIGMEKSSVIWWQKFELWFTKFKSQNDMMLAWDGDVIFDAQED